VQNCLLPVLLHLWVNFKVQLVRVKEEKEEGCRLSSISYAPIQCKCSWTIHSYEMVSAVVIVNCFSFLKRCVQERTVIVCILVVFLQRMENARECVNRKEVDF
jgi:hypothetical protein